MNWCKTLFLVGMLVSNFCVGSTTACLAPDGALHGQKKEVELALLDFVGASDLLETSVGDEERKMQILHILAQEGKAKDALISNCFNRSLFIKEQSAIDPAGYARLLKAALEGQETAAQLILDQNQLSTVAQKRGIPLTEFALRRSTLVELIAQRFKDLGPVVLFAAAERNESSFEQEPTFWYFSGVENPAAVLWIEPQGHTTLYLPNYGKMRAIFVKEEKASIQLARDEGVDDVSDLGTTIDTIAGNYHLPAQAYATLLTRIRADQRPLYMLNPVNDGTVEHSCIDPLLFLARIIELEPSIKDRVRDIYELVAQLRRTKSVAEIKQLCRAVAISCQGHEQLAAAIHPGATTNEMLGLIEGTFVSLGAQGTAYGSIVGTGHDSTIPHYKGRDPKSLHAGDVLLVDAGARYNYYCGDITRTFPISGSFTDRQQEIYAKVLEVKKIVESAAAPGTILSGTYCKERSTCTTCLCWIMKRALGEYDPHCRHGVGHYVGLDVHDAGDRNDTLKEDDIITIEPGIYLKDEDLGIRIEDMYLVVKGGVVCLSGRLPTESAEIKRLMRRTEDSSGKQL